MVVVRPDVLHIHHFRISHKLKVRHQGVRNGHFQGILGYIGKDIIGKDFVQQDILMNCLMHILLNFRLFIAVLGVGEYLTGFAACSQIGHIFAGSDIAIDRNLFQSVGGIRKLRQFLRLLLCLLGS